jgi:hypothetical protein
MIDKTVLAFSIGQSLCMSGSQLWPVAVSTIAYSLNSSVKGCKISTGIVHEE